MPSECAYMVVPCIRLIQTLSSFASRLAPWDSWGCGGNSVIATGCAHVAGVKACCLISLPSYSSSHVLYIRAPATACSPCIYISRQHMCKLLYLTARLRSSLRPNAGEEGTLSGLFIIDFIPDCRNRAEG